MSQKKGEPKEEQVSKYYPWFQGLQQNLRGLCITPDKNEYFKLLQQLESHLSESSRSTILLSRKPIRAIKFSRMMKRIIGHLKLIAVSNNLEQGSEQKFFSTLSLILTHYSNILKVNVESLKDTPEEIANDLYIFIKLVLDGLEDLILDTILSSKLMKECSEINSIGYLLLLKIIQEPNNYTRQNESCLKFLGVLKLLNQSPHPKTDKLISKTLLHASIPQGFADYIAQKLHIHPPSLDTVGMENCLKKIKASDIIKLSRKKLSAFKHSAKLNNSDQSSDKKDTNDTGGEAAPLGFFLDTTGTRQDDNQSSDATNNETDYESILFETMANNDPEEISDNEEGQQTNLDLQQLNLVDSTSEQSDNNIWKTVDLFNCEEPCSTSADKKPKNGEPKKSLHTPVIVTESEQDSDSSDSSIQEIYASPVHFHEDSGSESEKDEASPDSGDDENFLPAVKDDGESDDEMSGQSNGLASPNEEKYETPSKKSRDSFSSQETSTPSRSRESMEILPLTNNKPAVPILNPCSVELDGREILLQASIPTSSKTLTKVKPYSAAMSENELHLPNSPKTLKGKQNEEKTTEEKEIVVSNGETKAGSSTNSITTTKMGRGKPKQSVSANPSRVTRSRASVSVEPSNPPVVAASTSTRGGRKSTGSARGRNPKKAAATPPPRMNLRTRQPK